MRQNKPPSIQRSLIAPETPPDNRFESTKKTCYEQQRFYFEICRRVVMQLLFTLCGRTLSQFPFYQNNRTFVHR